MFVIGFLGRVRARLRRCHEDDLVEQRIVLRELGPAAAPGPLSLVALIVHLIGSTDRRSGLFPRAQRGTGSNGTAAKVALSLNDGPLWRYEAAAVRVVSQTQQGL